MHNRGSSITNFVSSWQTIPITLQTLRVIKEHCQKLEALSVCDLPTWGRQADDDTTFSWAESMTGNLSGMQAPGELFPSNLRCFNLHNMHGNLAAHRNIIVTVLKQCLRLEHLGLSLYRDYPLFGRQGEWWLFFDKLCDEYEENGGAPLKLKSLDLGSLVFPTREESLAKLTDLAHLTSLRVDNSDHTMLTNFPPAKFEAINAVNCPQLVHLALAKDSPDGADIVRRLLHAVDERLIQPPFPKLMDLLTSSHVVSYADLYSVWIMNSDDAPTQDVKPSLPFRMLSASLAVERDYDEDTGPEWDIHTAVESFHLLVQTTKDTLEGLAIELPCYIASPFKENDEESWGQPIPGDISMEVNLHISRLSHLTQLAVVVVGHEWGEVWNGLNDQQSLVLAEEYARLLPRLRYIRVDCWYWKVSRHWEDLGFTLQETERYEAGRVELFYRYFPTSTRGNNRAQVDRRDLPYLTVP